jgi:ABC-type multidrug transport system ATPase subunit
VDLFAEQGVILAVLGPNGAGKTTFVRCIATLIKPGAGTLRVFGHDVVRQPDAVRSSIGLAGQFAAVEPATASSARDWCNARATPSTAAGFWSGPRHEAFSW